MSAFSLPHRPKDGHKGTFGRIAVIAGSYNMAGAACFSTLAAYRAGAGLAEVFTPEENRVILQIRVPEAVLHTYREERFSFSSVKEELERASALLIGPGLGKSDTAKALLKGVLFELDPAMPKVFDADALNLMAKDPAFMDALTEQKAAILTPHLGELARLCGHAELSDAKKLATQYGVTVVRKSAVTVITDGDGQLFTLEGYNSGMATGGSGDILAGLIAGFFPRIPNPFEAAKLGILVHAAAGNIARERVGETAMIASDILDAVPAVLKAAEQEACEHE